ncbi:MAG TPA: hypothetical protein VEK07_02690 [Polyangiaceae bacterium]|nr:hypothetical protein [Polyangiaceae bacterium]
MNATRDNILVEPIPCALTIRLRLEQPNWRTALVQRLARPADIGKWLQGRTHIVIIYDGKNPRWIVRPVANGFAVEDMTDDEWTADEKHATFIDALRAIRGPRAPEKPVDEDQDD